MRKEFLFMALAAVALVGCNPGGGSNTPETDMPEWYYTGGKQGTTTNTSSMAFRQPTPATDEAGLGTLFAQGDNIAEKDFVTNAGGRQHGLGRSMCVRPASIATPIIRTVHPFLPAPTMRRTKETEPCSWLSILLPRLT